MRDLDHYQNEMNEIENSASTDKKNGNWFAWVMMAVGVCVTGLMTFSLAYRGMLDAAVWTGLTGFGAFLTVILLEGSAIALTYGKQHWFHSTEQRELAGFASTAIWIVLALTTVTHFALGGYTIVALHGLMSFYASYVLPLAIVGIPFLWKMLYDRNPDSMIKVAILESEAKFRSRLIQIREKENDFLLQALEESLHTEAVQQARAEAFEQCSIRHSRYIANFTPKQLEPPEEEVLESEIVQEEEPEKAD
jgi:hypothetical protein